MSASTPPKVFISYRRKDTGHCAGRLYDNLVNRFGEEQVFMDLDNLPPGVDFAEEINRAVGDCKVLLAVIGAAWASAVDERGQRRLDDPNDFVRLEIETAFQRGVLVIPILVDAASMPDESKLPGLLTPLARRHAARLRFESFSSDMGRLLNSLEPVLTNVSFSQTAPSVVTDADWARREAIAWAQQATAHAQEEAAQARQEEEAARTRKALAQIQTIISSAHSRARIPIWQVHIWARRAPARAQEAADRARQAKTAPTRRAVAQTRRVVTRATKEALLQARKAHFWAGQLAAEDQAEDHAEDQMVYGFRPGPTLRAGALFAVFLLLFILLDRLSGV